MRVVEWATRADKDLGRLDPQIQRRVIEAVERLGTTGHGDVKRLQATDPPMYRLRVGDWRILYLVVDERRLLISRVLPRGAAYR